MDEEDIADDGDDAATFLLSVSVSVFSLVASDFSFLMVGILSPPSVIVARAFALGLLMIRVGLRRSVFRTGDVRDCVAFLAAALALALGGSSSSLEAAAIRRAFGCGG